MILVICNIVSLESGKKEVVGRRQIYFRRKLKKKTYFLEWKQKLYDDHKTVEGYDMGPNQLYWLLVLKP